MKISPTKFANQSINKKPPQEKTNEATNLFEESGQLEPTAFWMFV